MESCCLITVDLRVLSKDTRVLLRWVARNECAMDNEARLEQSMHNPLFGVGTALLRRVEHKLRRMRFRMNAEEVECLGLVIDSVGDRMGAENLKEVQALMEGDDDDDVEGPYPYLPYQPEADREDQDEQLDTFWRTLSTAKDSE